MPDSPFRPLAEPVTIRRAGGSPCGTLAAGTSVRVDGQFAHLVRIWLEHPGADGSRTHYVGAGELRFVDGEPEPAPLPEPATARTRLAAALKVAAAMAADRAPVNAFEHLRGAIEETLTAPDIALYGSHECASHECDRTVGAPSTGPAFMRNDLPGIFCAQHGHVLLGYLVHPATVARASEEA